MPKKPTKSPGVRQLGDFERIRLNDWKVLRTVSSLEDLVTDVGDGYTNGGRYFQSRPDRWAKHFREAGFKELASGIDDYKRAVRRAMTFARHGRVVTAVDDGLDGHCVFELPLKSSDFLPQEESMSEVKETRSTEINLVQTPYDATKLMGDTIEDKRRLRALFPGASGYFSKRDYDKYLRAASDAGYVLAMDANIDMSEAKKPTIKSKMKTNGYAVRRGDVPVILTKKDIPDDLTPEQHDEIINYFKQTQSPAQNRKNALVWYSQAREVMRRNSVSSADPNATPQKVARQAWLRGTFHQKAADNEFTPFGVVIDESTNMEESVKTRTGKKNFPQQDCKVSFWQERDRTHVGVTCYGNDVADWWDDDARSMVEDGFFKYGDEDSVLKYLVDMGVVYKRKFYLAKLKKDGTRDVGAYDYDYEAREALEDDATVNNPIEIRVVGANDAGDARLRWREATPLENAVNESAPVVDVRSVLEASEAFVGSSRDSVDEASPEKVKGNRTHVELYRYKNYYISVGSSLQRSDGKPFFVHVYANDPTQYSSPSKYMESFASSKAAVASAKREIDGKMIPFPPEDWNGDPIEEGVDEAASMPRVGAKVYVHFGSGSGPFMTRSGKVTDIDKGGKAFRADLKGDEYIIHKTKDGWHTDGENVRVQVDEAKDNKTKLAAAIDAVLGWYEHSDIAHAMSNMGEQAEYHRTLRAARYAKSGNDVQKMRAALEDVLGWYGQSDIAHTMSNMGEQAEYHRTLRDARLAIAEATASPATDPVTEAKKSKNKAKGIFRTGDNGAFFIPSNRVDAKRVAKTQKRMEKKYGKGFSKMSMKDKLAVIKKKATRTNPAEWRDKHGVTNIDTGEKRPTPSKKTIAKRIAALKKIAGK